MKANLITLIIPCYNEAATVDEFYRRAESLADSMAPLEFEFIFVNDGI